MISTDPITAPFDVILISGDFWADHPHSGVGVIARVLESIGITVGIIEKPDWQNTAAFKQLGLPKFFFGITSGAIDSMLVNYTPLKKRRSEDPYYPYHSKIPDRAIIVYSHKVREAMNELVQSTKGTPVPIIIGGVEASLRRFTHYDYWTNTLRRPILLDSKADLLVYGSGEYQVKEIIKRLQSGQNLLGIAGTSIIIKDLNSNFKSQSNFELLASHAALIKDKKCFCQFSLQLTNNKTLIEPVDHRYMVQYRMHDYTSVELDEIYDLPFSYHIPEQFKEFEMAQFSLVTHRGCFGRCNFCSIVLHQGDRVISRSKANILREIERLKKMPEFKGTISDLGGPSANMYGMDCANACGNDCLKCPNLNRSHDKITDLLRTVRLTPGIKNSFVTSGIRYDLCIDADDYIQELSNHISGTLKIAPEHFSQKVLALMNKENTRFDEFKQKFDRYNHSKGQTLRYYLLTAHPGSTMENVAELKVKMQQLKNIENVQIFTPTPLSISTCMYYTGMNPYTMEPIYVPYSFHEKKLQKNQLFEKS